MEFEGWWGGDAGDGNVVAEEDGFVGLWVGEGEGVGGCEVVEDVGYYGVFEEAKMRLALDMGFWESAGLTHRGLWMRGCR